MARFNREHRREQLEFTATELAHECGLYNLTVEAIARKAHCARSTVVYHVRSLNKLRDALIRRAIEKADIALLLQAVARRDPAVRDLPQPIKDKMLTYVKGAL